MSSSTLCPLMQFSLVILVITIMSGQLAFAGDPDGDPAGNLKLIREHIAPLTRPLGDRLPVLAWQTPKTPTGLELGDVEGVWDTYMERGLMPLCNPMNSVATDERALVRTVSFGPSVRKTIRVFGKPVELRSGRQGRFFWITPDGTATAVGVVD